MIKFFIDKFKNNIIDKKPEIYKSSKINVSSWQFIFLMNKH